MKTFKFLTMMFIVLLGTSLTSCSDDDDDAVAPAENTLIGTWVEKGNTETLNVTLTFNKDGKTGNITINMNSRASSTYSENFNWSTVVSGSKTYINFIHTSGDSLIGYIQNQYILAGDELIVLFDELFDIDDFRLDMQRVG